jgi:hypothetical protein
MADLIDFEIDVLRLMAGGPENDVTLSAGLETAYQSLKANGYVDAPWELTAKGKAFLDSLEQKPDVPERMKGVA